MQPAKLRVSQPLPRSSDATQSVGPSVVRTFLRSRGNSAIGDGTFKGLVSLCALSIFGIVLLVAYELVSRSHLTLSKFGLDFFFRSAWDPVNGNFGAWPFICGTMGRSILALPISVTFKLDIEILRNQLCPQ